MSQAVFVLKFIVIADGDSLDLNYANYRDLGPAY